MRRHAKNSLSLYIYKFSTYCVGISARMSMPNSNISNADLVPVVSIFFLILLEILVLSFLICISQKKKQAVVLSGAIPERKVTYE